MTQPDYEQAPAMTKSMSSRGITQPHIRPTSPAKRIYPLVRTAAIVQAGAVEVRRRSIVTVQSHVTCVCL